MSKKTKKISTIPDGRITIISLLFCITCFLFVSVIGFEDDAFSIDLFVVQLVVVVGMLFIVWNMLRKKYMNHILVSHAGVSHKHLSYTWNTVCITVMWMDSPYENAFPLYYAFFSNHFMTRNEILSKENLKSGFYIVLTPKRAEILFRHYKKRIELLEQIPKDVLKKIPKIIFEHNERIGRNSSPHPSE